MVYVKTIVCFANSRKIAGRCIAGKEWENEQPGEWIRPVSSRSTHEISEEERRYQDGRTPQLLDILQVPCNAPQPLHHQRENHVIDSGYYWVKTGQLPCSDIHSWLDNPANLWVTGQSSYSGVNNRVAVGQENGISLYLVQVECLRLLVGRKTQDYPDSKRAVRGQFKYNGVAYLMDVTDPNVEKNFLALDDGEYDIPNPVLCISLGDPYQEFYYKLIAAILCSE